MFRGVLNTLLDIVMGILWNSSELLNRMWATKTKFPDRLPDLLQEHRVEDMAFKFSWNYLFS